MRWERNFKTNYTPMEAPHLALPFTEREVEQTRELVRLMTNSPELSKVRCFGYGRSGSRLTYVNQHDPKPN